MISPHFIIIPTIKPNKRLRYRYMSRTRKAIAVDLFCGAGGMTYGLRKAGITVTAGIDVDEKCRYAFEANNDAVFIRKDIKDVRRSDIERFYSKNCVKILVGCAPCQPFSSHSNKLKNRRNDAKWGLIREYGRLVRSVVPDIVSMENVPQVIEQDVFKDFVSILEHLNYSIYKKVVFCPRYGIPQRRSRLVLLASRYGPIELPPPTHSVDDYPTVRSVIGNGDLEPLEAGIVSKCDILHRASSLSSINMQRIKQSKPGGTWEDWDEDIRTECHKKTSGATYRSVYGRMDWNAPSPTITTQFFRFGTGRFGHPEQDRALSVREGALLQTFPKGYKFLAPGESFKFSHLGMLIGNAVPVRLAQIIGKSIKTHVRNYAG